MDPELRLQLIQRLRELEEQRRIQSGESRGPQLPIPERSIQSHGTVEPGGRYIPPSGSMIQNRSGEFIPEKLAVQGQAIEEAAALPGVQLLAAALPGVMAAEAGRIGQMRNPNLLRGTRPTVKGLPPEASTGGWGFEAKPVTSVTPRQPMDLPSIPDPIPQQPILNEETTKNWRPAGYREYMREGNWPMASNRIRAAEYVHNKKLRKAYGLDDPTELQNWHPIGNPIDQELQFGMRRSAGSEAARQKHRAIEKKVASSPFGSEANTVELKLPSNWEKMSVHEKLKWLENNWDDHLAIQQPWEP